LGIFDKTGIHFKGKSMLVRKIAAFPKHNYVLSLVLLLVITGFAASKLQAQNTPSTIDSFDIKKYSFNLPQPLPKGKYSYTLSIYYVVPPAVWTLDMVQAPMFNYTAKYTLGKGFNLQGGISTLLISNRLNAGPFWNYSHKNMHFGVGYQVGFNFGMLNQFGFKTTLTGWEQQPSITLGYSFKKTALTMRGDLYYTTSMQINEGGHKIAYDDNYLNGYSISAAFEQRLHKTRLLSMGLKMDYFHYHILAWPALPVNNYQYWIPEFQIGLVF
jgi:hypothetical protein